MADSESSGKGSIQTRAEARNKVALRIELRKLADDALEALEMIRGGEPPSSTVPDVAQQVTASDPELRDIELAAQNLVGAISVYLFNRT